MKSSFGRRVGRAAVAVCLGIGSALPAAPAHAAEPARVEWKPEWSRFRPAEMALTGGLGLQVAAAVFLYPKPQRNWEGGILFDDAVRDGLRLRSRKARDTAGMASDLIYYALAGYPLVVDVGVVTAGIHGSGDVALELMAMDLEAYAFSGAIALGAEKLGRVRPEDRGCEKDPKYSSSCGRDANLNASFMSGHTTIAFTGAGLICAHHQHLPLYGGGAPDVAACVTALAAASGSGVMRVMSDNHYATDVLLGMGVGLFGGYGLPTLLHYGAGSGGRRARASVLPSFRSVKSDFRAVVAPAVSPDFAGLTMAGTF